MQRRSRAIVLAAVLGALVLAGCDSDEGDAVEQTPVAGDLDGDGVSDEDQAPDGVAPEPVPPPTEPAQITPVPPQRSVSEDGGTIRVEGDRAAFLLPSGNIACLVTEDTAVCQVFDKNYTPEPDYLVSDTVGECSAQDANAMRTVEESAAWTCLDEDLRATARLDQGGWWEPEVDRDTLEVDGHRVAVLPYGESIAVGAVSCSATENGVVCRNPDAGNRRIQLSRTSFAYDRNG